IAIDDRRDGRRGGRRLSLQRGTGERRDGDESEQGALRHAKLLSAEPVSHIIMTRMTAGGTIRIAIFALGLLWPMTQAEMERALSIGRASDSERARFHQPYVVVLNDPTVDQIDVLTEFRRAVLFAEEQIRHGDHMFGLRQAEPALRPWHGKVTIVAR